jgi:low affinity Fe/Cu permease
VADHSQRGARRDPDRPSRIPPGRGAFDRFAERLSQIVGHAWFFTVAMILVLVWVPLIAVFESVDTWQLVLNTLTSVVAFLLIALLQNSERRNDKAVQQKLDTIATALAVHLREHESSEPAERAIDELEASVKLERDI